MQTKAQEALQTQIAALQSHLSSLERAEGNQDDGNAGEGEEGGGPSLPPAATPVGGELRRRRDPRAD